MNTPLAKPAAEDAAAGLGAPDAALQQSVSRVAAPFAGDDFDRDVWSILGLPVDMATAPEAVQAIEIAVRDRRKLSFVTPNVNFLMRALKDKEQRRDIIDNDLSLVDGAPLVAIGRLLGAPIRERCAGSDVFDALRRRTALPGRRIRVFFFGGREGAGEAAHAAIEKENRGLESAGYFNPGHGDLDSMSTDAVINRINEAKADFILVALGAAKGQAWIERNRDRLDAPVISHLGAVIDFAAGSIKRAPALVSRLGLEWAWRIKEEPGLWRRYAADGAAFMTLLAASLAPALAGRSSKVQAAPAAATIKAEGGRTVVMLSGDLVESNRAPVRHAFRQAAARGADVVLDFAAARRLDASFLGLVLLLEKNLWRNGAAIGIENASARQLKMLKAHSLNFAQAASESSKGEDAAIAAAV